MTTGEAIEIPRGWAHVEWSGRRGGITCNGFGKGGFREGWRPMRPTPPTHNWREAETFYCPDCGSARQKQERFAAAQAEADEKPRRARRKR